MFSFLKRNKSDSIKALIKRKSNKPGKCPRCFASGSIEKTTMDDYTITMRYRCDNYVCRCLWEEQFKHTGIKKEIGRGI